MASLKLNGDWIERLGQPLAFLALRLYLGGFLIWGVWDNITEKGRMTEFAMFLATLNCPWPEIAALVSVWAQLIVGALLILGLFTRWAGLVLSLNFLVAVILFALALLFASPALRAQDVPLSFAWGRVLEADVDATRRIRKGERMVNVRVTYRLQALRDTDGYRVVLFVDFARPLRQPWHWMNERFLSIGAFAPFLREAATKQAAWQKTFYRK